jgi:Cu/Zn superoxide dismutase
MSGSSASARPLDGRVAMAPAVVHQPPSGVTPRPGADGHSPQDSQPLSGRQGDYEGSVRTLGVEELQILHFVADANTSADGRSPEQVADGARITGRVTRLPPDSHGIHVHVVGACDGPTVASAGGHFSPGARKHGLRNPDGSHPGDLPKLEGRPMDLVGSRPSRAARRSARARRACSPRTAALVIHAGPDDCARSRSTRPVPLDNP